MNKEVSKILILCTILEGIITYISKLFVLGGLHYKIILSLIFGIFIAVAYRIDLLKFISIESKIPYVGYVLTGILFSRGSNYIYDIFKTFNLS